ncbi:DMT family transporter [Thermaurantiacus sp.]
MTARAAVRFAAVVLIWGTTWIVIKDQLAAVPPAWSVAYRFAAGGLALLLWCRVSGQPLRLPSEAVGFLALFALFQFVLNFNFLYRAELYVPSGIPAVAFALLMVPNAILARLFLDRPVSRSFVWGAALGVLGIGLLFLALWQTAPNRSGTALGLALTGAAVVSASVANVMQASPRAARAPALPALAWAMLMGAAMNALFAGLTAGPPAWDPRATYFGGVLFLGVVASALAFGLYFDLIRTLGPAEAAWTGVPIPILAMAISTAVEGYRWSLPAVLGAVLALAGLVTALGRPAARRQA